MMRFTYIVRGTYMLPLVRYNGKWFQVIPKPGEPTRMTHELIWMKLKENKTAAQWFEKERKISKLLYNE